MATKFTGRQFNVGAAKEATRGTALAAVYWLPFDTLTIDDVIKVAKDETVIGVIEAGTGQEVTTFESKGTLAGGLTDIGFGLLLKSTMGSETATVVSGETTVYDHKFTVLETAQHPSLTISVVEPNSNSGSGYGYPLSMVDELEIDFELDKYSNYKLTFMGNKGATLANTVSYTAENRFRPQDGTITIATTYSGLGSGTVINCQKASITIKKNTEADTVIGNTSPVDRLNKNFAVSGSLELKYADRTMIDTYMLAGQLMAIQLVFVNSNVSIGVVPSHPTFTLKLAKTLLESVARKIDPKGIVTQTVKFTAYYSMGDSEMLDITLRNTRTTAY